MRRIPPGQLAVDQILARPLRGLGGEVLVTAGQRITAELLGRVRELVHEDCWLLEPGEALPRTPEHLDRWTGDDAERLFELFTTAMEDDPLMQRLCGAAIAHAHRRRLEQEAGQRSESSQDRTRRMQTSPQTLADPAAGGGR